MKKIHNAQEAIEWAIKGGYDWRKDAPDPEIVKDEPREFVPMWMYPYCFISPLYWISLGKARGWGEQEYLGRAQYWFDVKINKWNPAYGKEEEFWLSLP